VDFDFQDEGGTWQWRGKHRLLKGLPRPALFGSMQLDNAAAVIAALAELEDRLPLRAGAIESGLSKVQLPGRFQSQSLNGRELIFDVAHNPAAAQNLARNLQAQPSARTWAVCGMFADKDVDGVIGALHERIQNWIVVGVGGPRALAPEQFASKLTACNAVVAKVCDDVWHGCDAAMQLSRPGDRIVVFGSFQTVGPALEWLESANVRTGAT